MKKFLNKYYDVPLKVINIQAHVKLGDKRIILGFIQCYDRLAKDIVSEVVRKNEHLGEVEINDDVKEIIRECIATAFEKGYKHSIEELNKEIN